MAGELGCRAHRGTLHLTARPTGQFFRGDWCALDDRGDLVERHGEHAVQHECDPFGGLQRVQHHEQCSAHRVGQQCLVFRVVADLGPRPGRAPAAQPSPPEVTCGSAACQGGCGSPRSAASRPGCLPDRCRLGPGAATPPGRHHRLAQRARHPVGNRSQLAALRLETLRQRLRLVHRSPLLATRRQLS